MPAVDDDATLVREQLEKILSSAGFAQNERLSGFLRFVVKHELEGKGHELKESLLGVEVFGRKPGYDPRQDSIVRTEAAKLRDRLAKYYGSEGAADPVIIELPKGGYIPVFRQAHVKIRKQFSLRVWVKPALAGIALLATVACWLWMRQKDAPLRIAVLPFQNISQDPANDYYPDGLTSEIISDLSRIDGLAVRSQTSSFAFKDKPRNVHEVGNQLGVDYILEGSVLRSGEHLRINVQFVRVRDDLPVWSGKFEQPLTGDLTVQDEISRSVVNNLRLTLGRGRRRYETNGKAWDLYLRARALPLQSGWAGYDQSIAPLQEAIAAAPSFAPAYAALASAYAARSGQFRLEIHEEVQNLRRAAEQAIRLDPLLAEAHGALGKVYAREGRWQEAENSFRRAIELDRNRSASHADLACYLMWPLGRVEDAIQELRIAEESDPLAPQLHYSLGELLIANGRLEKAASYVAKLPAGYPTKIKNQGRILFMQGRTDEAIQLFSRGDHTSDRANLGHAYGVVGRREEAEKLAIAVTARPIQQAMIFAGLGDAERTLDALERAAVVGPVRLGHLLTLPELSLLRGHPRLHALRKKVGLPE